MLKTTLKIIILAIAVSSCENVQKEYPTMGNIEILDPAMQKIVNPNAKIEKLADGMVWAEGPVWVNEGNFLLYSDTRQNIIYKWSEKDGLQQFIKPAGFQGPEIYSEEEGTNGLLINENGYLIACDHGNRRIAKINLKSKHIQTLVDRWEGQKFNSPNDICQHPSGEYYFTDPPYGLPAREQDTTTREIAENGVYKVDNKGIVTQVISNLDRPNGIALSAEANKLYVALSDGNNPYIMVYDIKDDGLLGEGSIFFDFKKQFPEESLAADGIKIDANGNLFAAAGDGVVVMNSRGKAIGRIRSGVHTANCAFGDGYLYLTSTDQLLRVKLKGS